MKNLQEGLKGWARPADVKGTPPTTGAKMSATKTYQAKRAAAIEAMRTGDESWNAGRASAWEDAAIHSKRWSGEELATRLQASVERLEATLAAEQDYEEREWLDGRLGSMKAARNLARRSA